MTNLLELDSSYQLLSHLQLLLDGFVARIDREDRFEILNSELRLQHLKMALRSPVGIHSGSRIRFG